ncbi:MULTISPECIES: hypothetical protein [Aequorivita]|uniref:Uncharacterized protein n=1 Tax=Aequorivita iocasae TaxID=2803865 RepID=A0ABX7DP10_9FLAO|nr:MULTISPECIES: hypothetical protein [Aequorivita]QQX75823.1 hypothetical protein JK629_10825 [Aequorivita iocasae]UCA55283.1 hypothetical protein LDL78_10880 [Aequorivita sp. F7]
MNLRKHIAFALFYFLLVALMGVLLRLFFVTPLPLNYKYILHAHSHTALLGWIYLGLTTLIFKIFLSEAQKPKLYQRIFVFTNLCIVGMLITFPIQGYALYSIIFSTLFLFASYWFAWFAIKYIPQHFKKRFSWKLIKTALWYLVISSVGPWAIGGVMATLGPGSIWYKSSIYFYLHFQYNGWFIIALLGVLFYVLEGKGIQFNTEKLKSFFLLLNVGVLFTVFLSFLWFVPPTAIYILGLAAAVAQLLAFYELYFLLKTHFSVLKTAVGKNAFFFLKIAGILMVSKLIMQLFSAFPYVADLAYQLKDFVIGYLHLVFLGIVITTMLAFLKYFKLITLPNSFLRLFLFAFASTELLIFYKAFALWLGLPFFSEYYLLIAILSCTFPVAVGVLFLKNLKNLYLTP